MPTHLISIASRGESSSTLEERLRKPERGVPVIARIEEDRLVLDLRTVAPDEEAELTSALTAALAAPLH